jgi:hypothetical protein
MPKQKRTVSIDRCPACEGKHTYQLELGTTYLFAGRRQRDREPMRELTLVLWCPVKMVRYKAAVVVPLENYLWVSEVDGTMEPLAAEEA